MILNANEGEGLVWLGIPADDFAAAVQFFSETPGLDVAFGEGNTVEPSGRERRQDPAVCPEAPLFGHYRSRKPVSSRPGARRSVRSGVEISGEHSVGRRLDVAQVPVTWWERP